MKNVLALLYAIEEEKLFPQEKKASGLKTKTDAYDKLRDKLCEEDKDLLDKVYEEFLENHLNETDIYYRLGIKTGFSLAQELL